MTNILLIMSDQHRFDCVGANGPAQVRTPHLDGLAASGANYTSAYTPNPLCTPARNSLMFGEWSFQHHVIANPDTEAPRGPDTDATPFSRLLADAGWSLGYVGKWHVSNERSPLDAQFGFEDYVAESEYGPWRRCTVGVPEAKDPAPNLFETQTSEKNRPTAAGILKRFGGRTDEIAPEQSRLAWGADHTIRLLDDYAAREQPFCLMWCPSEPHLPNNVPEPYASMYPPASIPPWPGFDDPLIGKPYIQAQQRRSWAVEDWTWENWAPVVGRYLGEISLLDDQIGRVLTALDASGAADDTIVVYTTDHGDMCGAHGMWDKHFVMYDDVVHVPLIVRWPGRIPPGTSCDGFVSHAIDLAATIVEAAGVPRPKPFAGTSLPRTLREPDGRQDIMSAYHGNQFGLYSQRMIRDRRWKYVWNLTAEDELYNLEQDPGEITNLAADPTVAAERRRLQLRLLEWLEDTDDPLSRWAAPVQLGEDRTR